MFMSPKIGTYLRTDWVQSISQVSPSGATDNFEMDVHTTYYYDRYINLFLAPQTPGTTQTWTVQARNNLNVAVGDFALVTMLQNGTTSYSTTTGNLINGINFSAGTDGVNQAWIMNIMCLGFNDAAEAGNIMFHAYRTNSTSATNAVYVSGSGYVSDVDDFNNIYVSCGGGTQFFSSASYYSSKYRRVPGVSTNLS